MENDIVEQNIDNERAYGIYKNVCKCGKAYKIIGQAEGYASEYDSDFSIVCDCGEYVGFSLPVN